MADHDLLEIPNVIGFGRGFKRRGGEMLDTQALVVLVIEKLPEVMLNKQDLIPQFMDGTPTDVMQVGILRAQANTGKFRPAPGGVSIGHKDITAGTFGVLVADPEKEELLILSNNHVLANSNAAKKGDEILQPGRADGGTLMDTIARLERWVPIAFEGGCLPFAGTVKFAQGPNLVDAAVARPEDPLNVEHAIIGIGPVMGTMTAGLQQEVRKSGRTTGLTIGEVQVIDAVVQVSYGSSGTAVFEQQIITGPMSAGGDSGSLLVDAIKDVGVGLLFAGSDQVTIYNPINEVLRLLKVVL